MEIVRFSDLRLIAIAGVCASADSSRIPAAKGACDILFESAEALPAGLIFGGRLLRPNRRSPPPARPLFGSFDPRELGLWAQVVGALPDQYCGNCSLTGVIGSTGPRPPGRAGSENRRNGKEMTA